MRENSNEIVVHSEISYEGNAGKNSPVARLTSIGTFPLPSPDAEELHLDFFRTAIGKLLQRIVF
jgi:hypothetical protein